MARAKFTLAAMKNTLWALAVLALAASSLRADTHVDGYTRQDGTQVAPHERTDPNSTTSDNYSHKGNVNPYTGKEGEKN